MHMYLFLRVNQNSNLKQGETLQHVETNEPKN